MEMKTVLRQLLSWADLSGTENLQLAQALQADTEPEIVDAETTDANDTEPEDIQLIVPAKDEWAISEAAKFWNASPADTVKNLTAAKLGKMTRAEFTEWLKTPKEA